MMFVRTGLLLPVARGVDTVITNTIFFIFRSNGRTTSGVTPGELSVIVLRFDSALHSDKRVP
jgi:hypothetical protein